jgi:hypothetical protein
MKRDSWTFLVWSRRASFITTAAAHNVFRELQACPAEWTPPGDVGLARDHAGTRGVHEGVTESSVLPGVDLAQLASYLDRPAASRAIREYRAASLQG